MNVNYKDILNKPASNQNIKHISLKDKHDTVNVMYPDFDYIKGMHYYRYQTIHMRAVVINS